MLFGDDWVQSKGVGGCCPEGGLGGVQGSGCCPKGWLGAVRGGGCCPGGCSPGLWILSRGWVLSIIGSDIITADCEQND